MNAIPISGATAPGIGVPALQGAGTQSTTQSLGTTFENALEGVADSLSEADKLSQQVATGQLEDLSQLTAAAAKAELAVQLTVAFRDRAVDSFRQIMQMQV